MNYRNDKLLRALRELPCQNCGIENGTVVAAHSNQLRHGKGRGIKCHDYFVAAMCFKCHAEIDQGSKLNKSERVEIWQSAWEKTIAQLFERGILNVK